MPFTEHSIGHGTIAYRGEDPDYWWRKSALWRSRRTTITVLLLVAGGVLLGYAVSPFAQHHATAQVRSRVVTTPPPGSDELPTARLRLDVLGEGPATVVTDDPVVVADLEYSAGRVVPVTTDGLGGTRLGTGDLLWPWVFGTVLVLVAAGRALWDRRTGNWLRYFR